MVYNGFQAQAGPSVLFCSASPPRRGGYAHVFFFSIAGRIAISLADPDISGEVTIVPAFTRHRARLQHNRFHRICLVDVVFVLSLTFASEGLVLLCSSSARF
jgi:hypothetical protein